ncbi:hypothetical protein EDB89DRAFT_1908399 [Lactarius sanguifluus]|nr:hypothetical protein EDB89DRAFT_1908399 [Lactarius sanguifluus]
MSGASLSSYSAFSERLVWLFAASLVARLMGALAFQKVCWPNPPTRFSFLPLVFVVGQVIGSSIGGFLSRPQDCWPDYFPRPFWAEYPYFLPCLVIASFSLIQFTIAAIFFEEPLPLRSLLTRPVVISITNYGTLALLEIAASAFIPLIWSMAIEFAGLGLTPADIGLWMSAYSCVSAVFQFTFFPRVIARFGPGHVVVATALAFGLLFALFPFEKYVGAWHGDSERRMTAHRTAACRDIRLRYGVQLSCSISLDYLGVHVHFFRRANKRSLGALNTLAQTVISTQRAVGPAAAVSLFAFSLQNNVLGGQSAYVVLLSFACVGLCVAVQLPRNTWKSQIVYIEHSRANYDISSPKLFFELLEEEFKRPPKPVDCQSGDLEPSSVEDWN